MVGITQGKKPSREGWIYLAAEREPVLCASEKGAGGRLLTREPLGFPYRVMLRGPGPGRAGRLRLMKAAALSIKSAAAEAKGAPVHDVGWIRINIAAHGATAGRSPLLRGERDGKKTDIVIDVPAAWLEKENRSVQDLRCAMYPYVRRFISSLHSAALPRRKGPLRKRNGKSAKRAAGKSKRRAKVLFFKNFFLKEVDRGESRQINPGIQYLVSPLVKRGVELILLDGKIPLQDVCEMPPHIDADLAPQQFISDPTELENALARNPDLSLVCLTVLERCFGQILRLCEFIRERSSALIAIGGLFPTHTPEHAFVHLPNADFLVRGDGEEILPDIVDIAAGRCFDKTFGPAQMEAIGGMQGVVASCGDVTVASRLDEVNMVEDLDRSGLDFSMLEKENVENGISISTSRGCVYNCRFCSIMDKRVWRAKSTRAVLRHLKDYKQRLRKLYGSPDAVPAQAYNLQIWDDDFFIDQDRAMELLPKIAEAGFRTTFLQGTVNSFFTRRRGRITDEVNGPLLDSLACGILTDYGGLKLGTENFVDAELIRLGKPYKCERIRKLALALAERNIDQEHYLLLCNRGTTLENLMENFEKIAELRWSIGPAFKVLEPSWLIEMVPTSHFKASRLKGLDARLPSVGMAAVRGYGEFDYPFIISDRPDRDEAFEIARRFPRGMHFGVVGRVDERDKYAGVHDIEDTDYLLIFGHVKKVLEKRRDQLRRRNDLAAMSELFRIERCLAGHFGKLHSVPSGLLGRIAPALKESHEPDGSRPGFLEYVRAMFAEARANGDIDFDVAARVVSEGIELSMAGGGEQLQFLVQRNEPGVPCAFATKNLAFVFRSPLEDPDSRPDVLRLMESLKKAAGKYDVFDLD